MRGLPVEQGLYEADATSVMLVSRVVETLLDRESAHVWSVA